jgi:putative ABC transport system permease protein
LSPLLWRSVLRHLSRHPWQLGLSVLGIALGVAVVLAVDLANASARKGFELSMEQITGRATHRIAGGPQEVPEEVYVRLRLELGLRDTAPVVSGYVALAGQPGRLLQVLGVDLFAEAPFRAYLSDLGDSDADLTALLIQPGAAFLPADLDSEPELLAGEQRVRLHSVGRLPDRLKDIIITDISTAQALLGKRGRLSHIDVIIPASAEGERLQVRLRNWLPPDLRLESVAERNQATADMSAAFALNLTAMSLLALIVGMFLIYNTMTFSVVQHRALLGMLRALGVSRREIFTVVLGEALLLGLAGTLLGSLLGLWLGATLVQLVTRTINDLYYVLNVREFYVAPLSLLKGAALGLLATLLAAWLPAWEAANAPPGAALSRAHLESRWRAALPYLVLAGLALLAAGGLVLGLSGGLVAGFTGLFTLILGCALLTPGGVIVLVRLNRRLSAQFGFLPRMATRDVSRHLSRTGVAVAALMVAFATTVGVGVMVDSFRGGVALWINDLVNADIYVAPIVLETGAGIPDLRPEVIVAARAVAGVAALSTYRRVDVRVQGRPAQLLAVQLAPQAKRGYHLVAGSPDVVWQAFEAGGAVIISEPLAYRYRLGVGDRLVLDTDQGPQTFPIAGVFLDYGSEHGRILIHRHTYDVHWNDRVVNSSAVYAEPGVDPSVLRQRLEHTVGSLQALVLRDNRHIQEHTLAVFDRTFTITRVLRLLAVTVAFVGVLSALMAMQLERAREFAILRATGMTSAEIARLVSLETSFMGLAAGLFAIPVGLLLAAVLIFVINRRAFGWTLPYQVDPWILVQAVVLALFAALLAGIYPSWRMARSRPADALRTE